MIKHTTRLAPIAAAGAITIALSIAAPHAHASRAIVTLTNGTTLHATIIEQSNDSITLNDPVLGQLTINRQNIVSILTTPADGVPGEATHPPLPAESAEPAPEAPADAPAEGPDAESLDATPDSPLSLFRGWEFEAAVGLNGSEGNSESFNLRAGFDALRETDRTKTALALSYNYESAGGDKTADRFLSTLRNDWKFQDSRWRFFAEGEFEYDAFQDWDWRWSAFAGPGYAFIDNDKTFLLGRVGLGVNQFVGGENDDVTPEALIGLEFDHKFTERQSFESDVTLFPDLDDTGEYRLVSSAAYSILVDPETNMSLKVGVEDRYNSNPGSGSEKNDLDYFLLLVWSF
ncbi:MAG: DUF481 domain-containing protein [Phycisphaerales bacterium]